MTDHTPRPSSPAPTDADMRAFGASHAACYHWPENTAEHKALRAAYIKGAADCGGSSSPAPSEGDEELAQRIENLTAEKLFCDIPSVVEINVSVANRDRIVAALRRPASHARAEVMREAAARYHDKEAARLRKMMDSPRCEQPDRIAAAVADHEMYAEEIRALPLPGEEEAIAVAMPVAPEAWAIVRDGKIDVRAIRDTRRATIISWLCVEAGMLVPEFATDEAVEKMWASVRGTAEAIPVGVRALPIPDGEG